MTQSVESRSSGAGQDQRATIEALVQDYLTALRERQVEKCVELFADDGTIEFQGGVFKGRQAREEWHRDRFAASFEILEVERVGVDADTATVEAVITSARLRSWKINKLSGKAKLTIEDGRIRCASLAPKMYNPFEGW